MKIFIETYGCDTNKVSAEIMAALLTKEGHRLVSKDNAELLIINSCVNTSSVERKVLIRLSETRRQHVRVLVTGCMVDLKQEAILQVHPAASVAGISSVCSIADIVRKIEGGMQVIRFCEKPDALVGKPRLRINNAVALVQIAEGCLENCTFCVDRSIRGSLRSYAVDRIINEVKEAILDGCIEIHLLAQDVASYGSDTGTRLPALLRKIGIIAGKYRIKIGQMNPANVIPVLDDLILAFSRPNIYKYLDLPLQSGSDRILQKMKRRYTATDYKRIIDAFRKRHPNITISTDVIVGFPGETEGDFMKTVELIEEVKPDILNVFAYSERPLTKGGPSDIPSWKRKERLLKLEEVGEKLKIRSLKKWASWKGEVFVSERSNDGYIGRNYAYVPVLVPCAKPGEVQTCEIYDSDRDYLLSR